MLELQEKIEGSIGEKGTIAKSSLFYGALVGLASDLGYYPADQIAALPAFLTSVKASPQAAAKG